MVRPEGIEPPAYRFEACRSIHLSYGRTSKHEVYLLRTAPRKEPCRAMLNVSERSNVAPEIGLPITGGLRWEEPKWDHRRFEYL